jgi:hypothetical protein
MTQMVYDLTKCTDTFIKKELETINKINNIGKIKNQEIDEL